MTRLQTLRRENGILYADEYLVHLRWAAVGTAFLLSFFDEFTGGIWLPLPLAVGVSVGLNLVLSVYGMRQRAFATGRPHLILIADAAQAGVATLLFGGHHSVFYPLFILLMVELAVALPVRLAAVWILGAGLLHAAAAVLNQVGDWTAQGASMIVSRFFSLLILGALALVFSEQIRREGKSRRAAEEHATQLTTLNELFFELNQPRANLEQTMSALLEGAGRLLHAEVGMILVCDATPDCWKWIARNGAMPAPPSEIHLADWGWHVERQELYAAGSAYHQSLPGVWANQDLQVVAGIRLNALAGNAPSALIIGRRGVALSDTEWLLLRALGREAELVARTVQFQQARQSFLSAIAHELHTPLTVLKTLLPTLNDWDQVPAAPRQEILTMVEQNRSRLESLTSDFLESTRLEAGAVTLRRQPLDLAKRVQRALDTLKPLFLSKQQQITVDVPSPLPRVNADRRRVDQIISSLLHNAYKFTPAGGMIRVVVRVDSQAVQMSIEDNGPGVPLAARDHIFDKFYSASAESALAGVGLGLFICRELVALHGGHLWYEASPEGGSRFCFTLPVTEEENDGESDEEDSGH